MAYANTTRAISVSFADRLSATLSVLRTAMQRRRVFAQTVNELKALSDRDLSDLGIHRSMIRVIAREAAYGK
jgi:uncharacterized protein YjiS (DUF1127 family)